MAAQVQPERLERHGADTQAVVHRLMQPTKGVGICAEGVICRPRLVVQLLGLHLQCLPLAVLPHVSPFAADHHTALQTFGVPKAQSQAMLEVANRVVVEAAVSPRVDVGTQP